MADPDAATALSRLVAKWFLDFDAPVGKVPPVARHVGSKVLRHTEGNRVTGLLDGEAYMRGWADSIAAMKGAGTSVLHTGLALDDVGVRGKGAKGWNALGVLSGAHNAGVAVHGMLSDHGYYGNDENQATIDTLFKNGLYGIRRDSRYPNLAARGNCCGSNHQKFVCIREPERPRVYLGSADVHTGRWDTSRHQAGDPDRYGKPTHELGVLIEGPAVFDLETTFLERWNDATRTALRPELPALPVLPPAVPRPGKVGTHAVQVLHTYGITKRGYSWSPTGEFTIWAAYLQAIRAASSYIYIEDQYFMAFDFPPRFAGKPDLWQDADLVFQLGAAIERGVKVLVVVPSESEEPGPLRRYQKYQRDIAADYLRRKAALVGRPDDFTIAALGNGSEPIYVHAKLMLVDDELVILGSANVNQKSMTHDSEVAAAIVDGEQAFARELRKSLWAEHLAVEPAVVEDPMKGYALISKAVRGGRRVGHTIPYDIALSPPIGHGSVIGRIDPYAGPVRT